MQTTTVFYIVIALLLSISVAYFQYYYKEKKNSKINVLLLCLRFLSIFLLMLLLINPTIKSTKLQNSKPVLSILIDNSKSIPFFKEHNSVKAFIENLRVDKGLTDKFKVKEFIFGNQLKLLDSISFNANETSIFEAVNSENELYKDKIAPIVLLSDGNQTIGNDYEFMSSKQKIYPIVFGDTVQYKDLKISQLNVNKYSFIKNKFPVEVLLNYEGKENVTSRFSIYKNGKTVFTKKVKFSQLDNSKTIQVNLTSTKEGIQYYSASIRPLNDEKNIQNNSKKFSVEVINEQTKVLILSSVLHPDLGALKKAIESNKQRFVDVFVIDKFKNQLNDYQLVIIYQPNNNFNKYINQIKLQNNNYLLISGANTDWNFINKQQLGITKKAINQTESYGAIFNDSFLTFFQKDIGYNQFAPLKDKFGEITISREHQTLLYQSINGLQTKQPLLVSFDESNQKSGVLFGEGVWKWRANSFLNTNSFQDFDEFIGNLVQYLASNKKRSRLEVSAENLYPANSTITIAAFYTDENYKFDVRANLEITISNKDSKDVATYPFSLISNSYQIEIENLMPGDYTYKVSVNGQNINKYGNFKITDYQIEEQFTNANSKKLLRLADKSGGQMFFKNQFDQLKKELLNNKSFFTTQKSIVKEEKLIDWKWVLFLVIILFSLEWFIRKYYGKI